MVPSNLTTPPDPAPGSVTRWLADLRGGSRSAALHLWRRYFGNMAAVARRRLRGRPSGPADEEDVALSAFDSFCRGAGRGRLDGVRDRGDLWPFLAAVTAHKAADCAEFAGRAKRGGGAAFAPASALDGVAGRAPDPAVAAEQAERCEALLARLGDPALEAVAWLRLDGHSVEEIADRLGCVPRTVERKMLLIRQRWAAEGAP